MAGGERTRRGLPLPAPLRPALPGALVLEPDVVLEALAGAAAADGPADVAAAVLRPLLRLP
ncbi:MAG: hypothetical protein JWM64_1320, partial [Frankiales bacterium]|nr:hypothetical protein [Frankiales bacterium]